MMRAHRAKAMLLLIVVTALCASGLVGVRYAHAELVCKSYLDENYKLVEVCKDTTDDTDTTDGTKTPPGTGKKQKSPAELALEKYEESLAAWQWCMRWRARAFFNEPGDIQCGNPPQPPPNVAGRVFEVVPPETIAYMAAAQLALPELTIGLGPSPQLNPWKVPVIGVNYWIFAANTNSVPRTGVSVGPASAYLSAKITRLEVKPDAQNHPGINFTCRGAGTEWRRGTEANTPSPTCGYVYTKPGRVQLLVTAIWTISWEVSGASGQFEVTRSATMDLDVKELHTVQR